MFSAVVSPGTVTGREDDGAAHHLSIGAAALEAPVKLGESVAVNGVCLTVAAHHDDQMTEKVLLDEMLPIGVLELLHPEESDSELKLALAKPALEMGPVHDSENEDDVVLLDDVVHHAIIAYAKSVE